jgi:hypothetical protein
MAYSFDQCLDAILSVKNGSQPSYRIGSNTITNDTINNFTYNSPVPFLKPNIPYFWTTYDGT